MEYVAPGPYRWRALGAVSSSGVIGNPAAATRGEGRCGCWRRSRTGWPTCCATPSFGRTDILQQFDVVVLGAGAAGLMCAIERRPARPARAAAGPCRRAGRENSDLRRRALQLHQPGHARRIASCRPIRISASRRWRATRRRTSLRWWRSTASPGTRRRSASCSATARRGNRGHAAGRMRGGGSGAARWATACTECTRADRFGSTTEPRRFRWRSRWCWRPAGCRSRRWARPVSRTRSPAASGCADGEPARRWCR